MSTNIVTRIFYSQIDKAVIFHSLKPINKVHVGDLRYSRVKRTLDNRALQLL